uniref:Uncharacterized protein n=1 Tax=Anguilla anguilla TaxID=7936 RepID=A0A0E9TKD6_ANGAN
MSFGEIASLSYHDRLRIQIKILLAFSVLLAYPSIYFPTGRMKCIFVWRFTPV